MSAPTRTAQQGTFFVTAVCAERHRVFQTDANAQLMFDILQHYRSVYRLHAFVIMPEHLHVLITPTITLERDAMYQGWLFKAISRRRRQTGRPMAA